MGSEPEQGEVQRRDVFWKRPGAVQRSKSLNHTAAFLEGTFWLVGIVRPNGLPERQVIHVAESRGTRRQL